MPPELYDPGQPAPPLRLSPAAIARIRHLADDEGNDLLKLRVFVTGGGCSGFQYGFAFEERAADDDTLVEQDGAALIVDSLSFPYLQGSTVDYVEDLSGARFRIDNPNATTTCSCGLSFSA